MSPSARNWGIVAAIVVGVVAALAGMQAARLVFPRAAPAPDIPGLFWPSPKALTPFSLEDQRGRVFDEQRLRGKWTLLFFGYTHCPDVCPTTLAVMARVDEVLGTSNANADMQYAFVSVDPERDTRKPLGSYVEYFNPTFLGITGPEAKLSTLTQQLGVLAIKLPPDDNGDYFVDHTAAVLMIDPQVRFIALFRAPHEASDIAARITRIRRFVAD